MKWANETETAKQERRDNQIKSENNVLLYSRSKYWDGYNRAPDEGIPEQNLLDSSVVELTDTFQEWLDSIVQNPKTPDWVMPMLELGAAKLADITIRSVIRCWFSSGFWGQQLNDEELHTPPIAQTVATLIAKDSLDIVTYQRAKKAYKNDWMQQSKFIKNWTAKRCKAFTKRMEKSLRLTVKQQHDFGHHMLRIAATSNIINLVTKSVKKNRKFRRYSFVEFHESILKELHERHLLLETSSLIYRPMVTPPELHTLQASGGYIKTNMRKPMVQRFKSNFFGDQEKEQKYSKPSQKVVNSLNGLMLTEWQVNSRVKDVMEAMFANDSGLANIPCYSFESFMFNEEYPTEGTKVEKAIWCQQRQAAWSDWYKQEQSRGRMLIRLKLASDLERWEYFYHVWTLDFRGRGYTICELLSPQSSDFDKGLVCFANEVVVTPEGRRWQKINVANLFDQDHLTLQGRVQWTEDNEEMLYRIDEDPYDNKEWIDDRKKKNVSFQRLAAVLDYCRKDGKSCVPVQVDGKCNGNQHWAAIMKDPDIGSMVGLVPQDEPKDLYQHIANTVTEYCVLHEESIPWCGNFLEYWEGVIDRKITKRSTMCDPYGLTFYGIQKYLKVEGHLDWVDNEQQGGAITELARAIRVSMDRCLAEPNKGKEYVKSIVSMANDLNRHVEWETPSGFIVVHHYNKITTKRSISHLFKNKELVFFTATDDVNKRSASQAIAPNFIHSLDAAHMFNTITVLLSMGIFSLSMIHDSYGCHCNYVGQMLDVLREEFVKIHKENQLEKFKHDVQNNLGIMLPVVPETGNLNIEGVRQSDYFFA